MKAFLKVMPCKHVKDWIDICCLVLGGTKQAVQGERFSSWPRFCFLPLSPVCTAVAEAEEAEEKQKWWVVWKTLSAPYPFFINIAVIREDGLLEWHLKSLLSVGRSHPIEMWIVPYFHSPCALRTVLYCLLWIFPQCIPQQNFIPILWYSIQFME